MAREAARGGGGGELHRKIRKQQLHAYSVLYTVQFVHGTVLGTYLGPRSVGKPAALLRGLSREPRGLTYDVLWSTYLIVFTSIFLIFLRIFLGP